MVKITTDQRSYTNSLATLNVSAMAKRTGANKVTITAEWSIYTARSSLGTATRYLVLFVDSKDGRKYYSPNYIRTGLWEYETTYKGTVVFDGVELAADKTDITIGFGVSQSNTYMTSSGTLIWNGESEWASVIVSPEIQFGTVTGIAQGYTACSAPTVFTVSPEVFKRDVELAWDGAEGGINNGITGYEIEYATSFDGTTWSQWWPVTVAEDSPVSDTPGIALGAYQKFRIRTQGSAGATYYSDWMESNAVRKAKAVMYIHNGNEAKSHGAYIHNGTEKKRYTPYVYDGTKWVIARN